jgi:hypothetical protein
MRLSRSHVTRRQGRRLVQGVTLLALVAFVATTSRGLPASAADVIDPQASGPDLAHAITADPTVIAGASLVSRPPAGAPTGLLSQPLAGFPRLGQTANVRVEITTNRPEARLREEQPATSRAIPPDTRSFSQVTVSSP